MCAIPAAGRRRRADRPRLAARPGRHGQRRWSSPRPRSAGSTRSTRWAARRRSSRSPTAPRRSPRSTSIAGPGNAWVQEAKRAVFGQVGIDSLAGPSELMVIAGHDTDPEWAALDLCAQAEHGADSPLVVAAVEEAVLDASRARPSALAAERPSVADAPLALVQVPDLERRDRPRQRLRPRAPAADRGGRGAARRAGHDRRLRLRRPLRRHRLRRLRRRLQPRAADRRRRSLLRAARPRRLPPPDRDGRDSRRGGGEAGAARRRARPRRGLPGPRRVGDD